MRTNGDVAWRSLICAGITVQGPDMRSAEWPADERLRASEPTAACIALDERRAMGPPNQ